MMDSSVPHVRPSAGDVSQWFGLTYANFAVFPRSLLQSMPAEWQQRFYTLMTEYDDHWRRLPKGFEPVEYRVQAVENGRLKSLRDYRLPHYNRTRTHVTPDGIVTGEGWR